VRRNAPGEAAWPGNLSVGWGDYRGVECEMAREAASADLDAEQSPVDQAEVAAHLADCDSCRAWLEAAQQVTRRVRLSPAEPTPDRADALLAAVLADQAARVRRRMGPVRIGLVIVAGAQLLLGFSTLLFGDDMRSLHLTHELDTFDLALVVGFVTAARRPAYAAGMLALVGVAAVGLLATAVLDVADGHTSAANEVPHLLALAGWLLLCRLALLHRGGPEHPTAPQAHPAARRRLLPGIMNRRRILGASPLPTTEPCPPTARDPAA
jgi:predicted anti-sigma-YlaC factor YlaD